MRPSPSPLPERSPRRFAKAGLAERVTVQSFDWRTLHVLKEIAPDIARSLPHEREAPSTPCSAIAALSPWTAGLDIDA